jgi:hypothetical protein
MNHYTYLLINKNNGMLYIGKRSCKCTPYEDTSYMSSSTYVPKNECIKVILKEFTTAEEAIKHEIHLHDVHNVSVNPTFYNKSKQTSTGFDTTGISHPCTEEAKAKLSAAKKGKVPKWSKEGKEVIRNNMEKGRAPEVRKKASASLKRNGSNKGTKNSQFKPWFITTEHVTHLFTNISKSELSVKHGHYNKYYADLQKKFNKSGIVMTKRYGKIVSMGFLPEKYKI